MEEYVRAAIRIGLKEIVFLEHLEEAIVGNRRTWLDDRDFDAYFAEGERLRTIFGEQIKIGLGVECGYNPEAGKRLRERLLARHWDQIGISCHFLRLDNQPEHLNLFSRREENLQLARQQNPTELLTRYFATLSEGIDALPATKVCHLDGALRWLPEIQLSSQHHEQIGLLLEKMRKKELALEVNTSGITIRGEQFPQTSIISQAQKIGVSLCLGSDAHQPADVGQYFQRFC